MFWEVTGIRNSLYFGPPFKHVFKIRKCGTHRSIGLTLPYYLNAITRDILLYWLHVREVERSDEGQKRRSRSSMKVNLKMQEFQKHDK